jgi:hypothetical protein
MALCHNILSYPVSLVIAYIIIHIHVISSMLSCFHIMTHRGETILVQRESYNPYCVMFSRTCTMIAVYRRNRTVYNTHGVILSIEITFHILLIRI